jgi:hypothetical protein
VIHSDLLDRLADTDSLLIASMATLGLNSGLWLRRLLNAGGGMDNFRGALVYNTCRDFPLEECKVITLPVLLKAAFA